LLDAKKIVPEFKPPVKAKDDLSQIDPMFTQENAVDSLVEKSALGDAVEGFEGFAYVGQSAMDGN